MQKIFWTFDRIFQALTLCEMYVLKLYNVIQQSICYKKEWQLLYALEKDIARMLFSRTL